ncbi:tryptorubin family RiPP precursor [Streptomyces sp. NPDC093260]
MSHRPPPEGGAVMKLLFAVRNKVTARKSLKASAWYIWY